MDLVAKDLDNDTRGWIMCIVSGIACVFGASVICVDVLVRFLPGKHNFRIEESNAFLACSLSLSFGVMLFSSLYSMLPESKGYLKDEGWADQPAGFVMMACFIAGFFGIQAVSRFLHQYIPSHVVDCDHSHDQHQADIASNTSRQPSRTSRARRRLSRTRSPHFAAKDASLATAENGAVCPSESTPLLDPDRDEPTSLSERHATVLHDEMSERPINGRERATTTDATLTRRPSMYDVQKRVISFVKDTKCNCDEEGRCYGYTDPCAQECFKHLSTRSTNGSRHSTLLRTTTGPFYPSAGSVFHGGQDYDQHDAPEPMSPKFRTSRAASRDPLDTTEEPHACGRHSPVPTDEGDVEAQHHHHVPTNAFLSIGLQTSIAIALHKFPEGFITYATNHANPTLGFNVFMALFVHNITEGFALALPLYMALGSRWRAMLWSSLLGGLSQPIGAAVAALWFKLAQRTHLTPNAVAYACLFAVTSGIMVSVALQLFVEGLSLNHNRNLCIFFGFIGMALLGLSNALFAGH
ncbi:ZIP zinc transporter [Hirsutella rhossiliensis]|uniref:ZIP zinc transporter domain-containing protein n=1 Tax=Hirsutella rhossiliensis TaxID=111463 RepID=A0A9P8N313_9HYPO|nr:ZIP zinc transporter domain-containing protein [Hirsutella rhossiliensis]KAH0965920.1 ZIP zinc transporter domain-containing protein [Hirsutella rhossiliensis]